MVVFVGVIIVLVDFVTDVFVNKWFRKRLYCMDMHPKPFTAAKPWSLAASQASGCKAQPVRARPSPWLPAPSGELAPVTGWHISL